MLLLKHPRRPRGSYSGQNEVNWAKIVAAKIFYKSKRAPGNEPLHTISKRLCKCWLLIEQKKILCIILLNRQTVTSESLSCVLTRQFISIYIREPQKSRGIISDARKKYISRSAQIFSLGLIRGIENSGLFTCLQHIGGHSEHSSDLVWHVR